MYFLLKLFPLVMIEKKRNQYFSNLFRTLLLFQPFVIMELFKNSLFIGT